MEELLNGYFLQVLTFVCINIILAMTIYMTLCTGILSLGNAGLMSFGAYTSAILTAEYNFPMPLGILLGGCTATIVALIIGLPLVQSGAMTGPGFAMAALLSLSAAEAFMGLPAAFLGVSSTLASARRVFAILDRRPLVVEPAMPTPLPAPYLVAVSEPAR